MIRLLKFNMAKTPKQMREIMKKHLCWGSLVHCCKGRCASKENCMRELGMKAATLVDLKKDFDKQLITRLKGGKK